MESAFEVTELDPLPIVNRREVRKESKKDSKPSGSSTTPSGAAAFSPCRSPVHVPALAGPVPEPDPPQFAQYEGDCTVLVRPFAGDNRPAPERIARLLQAVETQGVLVDVSMSGLALHLTHEVAPGTRVALRISNRAYGKRVDTAATVLRCGPEGDTGWNVVCRLDKNLTFEQIHMIGRDLFASTIV